MFKKKVRKTTISNIEPEVMTKQMEQDYMEKPKHKGSIHSKTKENKYEYISIKEKEIVKSPRNKRKKKKLEIAARKEQKLLEKQRNKNNQKQTLKEEKIKFEDIKKPDISVEIVEEVEVSQANKKDLSEYFEESKRSNRKLIRKEFKRSNDKQEKKQSKILNDFQDIKNRKVYVYRKKRYESVEDFISFLNENHLNIDRIAKDVLDDEKFYGWISERSGVFDFSITEFKVIKEKIEKI